MEIPERFQPGGASEAATCCRGNMWINGKGLRSKPRLPSEHRQTYFLPQMDHKEPNLQNKIAVKTGGGAFL